MREAGDGTGAGGRFVSTAIIGILGVTGECRAISFLGERVYVRVRGRGLVRGRVCGRGGGRDRGRGREGRGERLGCCVRRGGLVRRRRGLCSGSDRGGGEVAADVDSVAVVRYARGIWRSSVKYIANESLNSAWLNTPRPHRVRCFPTQILTMVLTTRTCVGRLTS